MLQESEPAHVLSQKAETIQGRDEDLGSLLPIIQSAMLYNQVCYFGNSKKTDTERLDKVAKIVGAETATPSTI